MFVTAGCYFYFLAVGFNMLVNQFCNWKDSADLFSRTSFKEIGHNQNKMFGGTCTYSFETKTGSIKLHIVTEKKFNPITSILGIYSQ